MPHFKPGVLVILREQNFRLIEIYFRLDSKFILVFFEQSGPPVAASLATKAFVADAGKAGLNLD